MPRALSMGLLTCAAWVALIAAAVLRLSPLAHAADAPTTAPTTAPGGPPTHTVQRGTLSFEVKADGTFQASDCFELRPMFKSYVGTLIIVSAAAPGKPVRKGDLLLGLDPLAINWGLAAAENDATSSKAALTKAESDVEVGAKMDALSLKNQEDAVRNAEMGRQWWDKVDGPQMIQSVELNVKAAQASVDDQNDELEQLRKMYKSEELTSATADIVVKRAVRQLEQSRVGLKMQEERRDKVKTFDYTVNKQRVADGVDGAKQQLELLKSSLTQTAVNRRAAVTTAKIAAEQATKRLGDLKDDLANFTVKAPCDGVVEYGTINEGVWTGGDPRGMRVGERINAGQVILRLFEPGKLKLVVPLPESQAFWVEPGMIAKIMPAACPQISYRAKCGPTEPMPRGNPPSFGLQVAFDLAKADKRLIPGMKANVVIDCGKSSDVIVVPIAAVTAGKVLLRNSSGKVRTHSVTVGRSDGQSVEIKKGLEERDVIVLPGKK